MRVMEHDALSKLFFALPSVQADVLRIVARGWVHLLDLDTLERVSAEHAAPDLTHRAGDQAWRVRFLPAVTESGGPLWLLVTVEFQSSFDARMGLRNREYVDRHLEALLREGAWAGGDWPPPVLPVVVYDGAARWRRGAGPLGGLPEFAALALAPLQPGGWALLDAGAGSLEDWPVGNRVTAWARLLRSATAAALAAALDDGLSEFPGLGDLEFRKALRLWAQALLRARAWASDGLAAFEGEQGEHDMATLIEVNGRKIRADLIEQGRIAERERLRGERERLQGERERLRRELLALPLEPEMAARVSQVLDAGE